MTLEEYFLPGLEKPIELIESLNQEVLKKSPDSVACVFNAEKLTSKGGNVSVDKLPMDLAGVYREKINRLKK